jgi:hypothetical protein
LRQYRRNATDAVTRIVLGAAGAGGGEAVLQHAAADIQWRNPVMFVVEVGAALTLAFIVRALFAAGSFPAGYAENPISMSASGWCAAWGCARS